MGFTAKNGPETTVLEPKKRAEKGSKQGPKANFSKKNWSFRAKNWPKIAPPPPKKGEKMPKYEMLKNWAEN